jgi:excinuclease ABC subunit A
MSRPSACIRDNEILLDSLAELASHRNTLVVEHDEDTIRRADHVLDLGPAAGVRGGEIVGEGKVADLMRNPRSTTGRFLRNPLTHPAQPQRAVDRRTLQLKIERIELHNVRKTDVCLPIGRLVVVTGVSGSGKSTVARDVLYTNLKHLVGDGDRNRRDAKEDPRQGNAGGKGKSAQGLIGCRAIRGTEHIDRVLEVDQTPIGKTPRSCPATYIGFWDEIRRIFANTTEARIRGYTASRFSFNTRAAAATAVKARASRPSR